MLNWQLRNAGLPEIFSPHSVHVLVSTDQFTRDVCLEDVQYLASQADPGTASLMRGDTGMLLATPSREFPCERFNPRK